MKRLHSDERGVAILTAVISSAIIVVMGTTVVQLAIHNSDQSANDRQRVQAVGAAEAGLDYYMSYLTATGGQQLKCAGESGMNRPMVGSPGRFEISPTFYSSTGAPLACPPEENPGAVLIRSTGFSGPAAHEVSRTMEAYARLTISSGATFDNAGAIIANNAVNFNSNATIGGSNFSDADVYSNGTVSLASNSTLYGRIFAQGALTMQSNAEAKKDVWTKGNITMSAGAAIRGSATASGTITPAATASITLANNARIDNGAKASGAITGGTVAVYRSPNQTNLEPPPTRPYPTFTYVPSDWTSAGYTIVPFADCPSAVNYIKNLWVTGGLLVRVTSTCNLTFTNAAYTVKGNLAIVADGPVTFNTGARFNPTAGTMVSAFLMGGLSGNAPCDITMNTNSGFGPGLATLIYTPQNCTANLSSNTALTEGQILAGTVNFHHTAQFSYKKLTVPGTGAGGFKQDVFYKREIIG
jgi:hypothetical protein